MGLSICIHNTTIKDSVETRNELLNKLESCFPGKVFSYYNGSLMVVDRRIHIDFRCGDDFSKLCCIHPDYYYSDSDKACILSMFEQGADKVNGRSLSDIDQVIVICIKFINSFKTIDEMLEKVRNNYGILVSY